MIEHRNIAGYVVKSPLMVLAIMGSILFNGLFRLWLYSGGDQPDPGFVEGLFWSSLFTYFVWGAFLIFTDIGKLATLRRLEYRVVKVELSTKGAETITVYRTQERCKFPFGWGVWNDVIQSASLTESTSAFSLARELRAELDSIIRKLMLSANGPQRTVTEVKENEDGTS